MRLTPPQPGTALRGVIALGCACLLQALGPGRASAQEASFSAGLQQLGDLGMPPMKGARWVTVADNEDQLAMHQYMLSQIQADLKGNAWQLPTDPPTYLGLASPETIHLASTARRENPDATPSLRDKIRAYASRNAPDANQQGGAPQVEEKTLIQRDVARIIQSLRKESTRQEINQSMEWGGYNELLGSLLLFAVQIQLSGDSDTAGQLAAALFQTVDNNLAIIDQAVNLLADRQYQAICASLYEEGDWDNFLGGIKATLEKYPRGWKNRPAVDMLAARVASRRNTPVPATIDGIEIDAAARALLARLVEKPAPAGSDESLRNLAEQYGLDAEEISPDQRRALLRALMMGEADVHQGQPWLLQPPEADASSPLMDQIKALGMRALPALAAAVEDETLTLYPRTGSESYGRYSDEGPESLYLTLNRPSTRGELACQLLQSVIPIGSDPYQSVQASPDMLRELALELWRRHKDSPPSQLAAFYLRDGQHQLKQTAATFLTGSDDPAAHQAFEETVLQSTDPLSMLPFVEQYLSQRKAGARSFGKAFIQILKDGQFDQETLQRSPMGHSILRAGGIDKYVDTLLLKIGDVSLVKLLDRALQDDTKPDPQKGEQSAIMALEESIQDVELDEIMQLFAGVSERATPQQWEEIHTLLLSRAERAAYAAEMSEEPVKRNPIRRETLELWRPLRQRDTPLVGSAHRLAYLQMIGCSTIGDATTILLDIAAGQAEISTIFQCSRLYQDASETLAFSRQRVEALLKDEPPAPWPSRDAVTDARSEEILAQLKQLPATGLMDYASSLNMNEKQVVLAYSTMHQGEEEVPANLAGLNRRITTLDPVYRRDHDREFVATLGVKVGDPVDEALIIRIADLLLADTARYSPSSVMITRGPMELGSTIQASTPALKTRNTLFDFNLRNLAMMMSQIEDHEAVVSIQNGQHYWMRVQKDGTGEWIHPEFLRHRGEQSELTDAITQDVSMLSPTIISLMTRDQAREMMKNQFNPY